MDQDAPSISSESPAGDELRRAMRKGVAVRAQLRDRNSDRFKVDIVDLSMTGFRAEIASTFRPDQTVWLTLPGYAGQEAVVEWATRFHCGCSFVKPLHPSVFDHIVALAQPR